MSDKTVPYKGSSLDETSGDILPGTLIDELEIVERLAAGGFGTLYKAFDRQSGRFVAVKVMHSDLVAMGEPLLRFVREARFLELVRHPNVASLLNAGRLPDGAPYIVMEFLEGIDLGKHIRRNGRLTLSEALSILGPTAEALDAAHRLGIIHRDVKSSNIFLAQEGHERRVVLLDFGVAKLAEDGALQLTKTNHLVGTPAGVSPEHILGEPIDARADIYALAVLTYHMLVGRLPFENDAPEVLFQMHVYAERPRVSQAVRVPAAVDIVVARAMAVRPEDRPDSATEYFHQLRIAAGAEPQTPAKVAQALGLYIELRPDETLDEDSALERIEQAQGAVDDALTRLGTIAVEETSRSWFDVIPLPTTSEAQRSAREHAMQVLRELRAQCVPMQVEVHIVANVGEAVIRDGQLVGGDLRDVEAWRGGDSGSGFVVSDEALDGTDLEPTLQSERPGWVRID